MGQPDNNSVYYEFLLYQICLIAAKLNDKSYFEYYCALYDVPFFRQDCFYLIQSFKNEFSGKLSDAKKQLELALAYNQNNFDALVLGCDIYFKNQEIYTSEDASYFLEVLMNLNPNAISHALMSRFSEKNDLEKVLIHSQMAFSLYFESPPVNLELIFFSKD